MTRNGIVSDAMEEFSGGQRGALHYRLATNCNARASVVFLMHSQVHARAHTHTHEQHAKTLVTSHLYLLHCAE